MSSIPQEGIRDLSGIIPDIAREALLPESLDMLRQLDFAALPLVSDSPRLGFDGLGQQRQVVVPCTL